MCQHSNSFLCRLLSFFRIIDEHDYSISLTNIAMYIVMWKLISTNNSSIVDLGAFFCALSGYNFKKYINKDAIAQATTIANKVTEVADKLTQKES